MNLYKIIFTSLLFSLIGMLFLAYELEWIIIRSPLNTHYLQSSLPGVSKHDITFWYWHNQNWKQETKGLIICDDTEKKTATIIANWLTLLHEEKIAKRKIVLQSAIFGPTNVHLYISFDQSPFSPPQSTHDKWRFIEGLKKTLQTNGIKAQGIYFLVNHAVLEDEHLDFSNALHM